MTQITQVVCPHIERVERHASRLQQVADELPVQSFLAPLRVASKALAPLETAVFPPKVALMEDLHLHTSKAGYTDTLEVL